MESGALSDASFPEFAENVVLFLHNTSRVKGEPYPTLLKDNGGTGFPTLWFLDADGKVITKQGERTVKAFGKTMPRP